MATQKKDKTKILMTTGGLMILRSKVLQNAPRGAFCKTFDLHKAIIDFEWPPKTGFTVDNVFASVVRLLDFS